MSQTAVILIRVQPGELRTACNALKEISGVMRVMAVIGPWDVIAIVETQNERELGFVVVDHIQKIMGVVQTLTLKEIDIFEE